MRLFTTGKRHSDSHQPLQGVVKIARQIAGYHRAGIHSTTKRGITDRRLAPVVGFVWRGRLTVTAATVLVVAVLVAIMIIVRLMAVVVIVMMMMMMRATDWDKVKVKLARGRFRAIRRCSFMCVHDGQPRQQLHANQKQG